MKEDKKVRNFRNLIAINIDGSKWYMEIYHRTQVYVTSFEGLPDKCKQILSDMRDTTGIWVVIDNMVFHESEFKKIQGSSFDAYTTTGDGQGYILQGFYTRHAPTCFSFIMVSKDYYYENLPIQLAIDRLEPQHKRLIEDIEHLLGPTSANVKRFVKSDHVLEYVNKLETCIRERQLYETLESHLYTPINSFTIENMFYSSEDTLEAYFKRVDQIKAIDRKRTELNTEKRVLKSEIKKLVEGLR